MKKQNAILIIMMVLVSMMAPIAVADEVTLTEPTNESTDISVYGTTLSWNTTDPNATSTVYFGTSDPPTTAVSTNQSGTTYDTGSLVFNETYYWKVQVWLENNNTYTSDQWSFTVEQKPNTLLQLTGAGQSTQFTPTGGNNWECMDDYPYDDSDCIYGNQNGYWDSYEFDNFSFSGSNDTIDNITIYTVYDHMGFWGPDGDNCTVNFTAYKDGTTYDFFSFYMDTVADPTLQEVTIETSPFTGKKWTQEEINATEFGIRNTGTGSFFFMAYGMWINVSESESANISVTPTSYDFGDFHLCPLGDIRATLFGYFTINHTGGTININIQVNDTADWTYVNYSDYGDHDVFTVNYTTDNGHTLTNIPTGGCTIFTDHEAGEETIDFIIFTPETTYTVPAEQSIDIYIFGE